MTERNLIERLEAGGFVAAAEEAQELEEAAGGDPARLEALLARRLTGEPLAWITGFVDFAGVRVRVDPGVYVPRWQTEALALRAVERLPATGTAIDLCTGAGAIAKVLATYRRQARVVAADLDPKAVACARANDVEAHEGDLFAALPRDLHEADLIVAVVPYVPTPDLPLLQRDTFTFETPLAYDGGADGAHLLRRVVAGAPAHLVPGGTLLLELGGRQAQALAPDLDRHGFGDPEVLRDEDGDVRAVQAVLRLAP